MFDPVFVSGGMNRWISGQKDEHGAGWENEHLAGGAGGLGRVSNVVAHSIHTPVFLVARPLSRDRLLGNRSDSDD